MYNTTVKKLIKKYEKSLFTADKITANIFQIIQDNQNEEVVFEKIADLIHKKFITKQTEDWK